MARGRGAKPVEKVGFWQMIRDVLVTSINKGQFPLGILLVILIVPLIRMPAEDVSKLVFRVLDDLGNAKLVGYAVAVAILLGWFIHAKFQRRVFAEEMKRVASERTRWQEKAMGKQMHSSEKS